MLEHGSPSARRLGAKLVGRIGDRASIPKLRGMLASKDQSAAAGAAESLGLLGDRASIGPLAALLGLSRHDVGNAAWNALVRLEAYDRVPEMIEAIERADVYHRSTLVQGLVDLRAEEAAPNLERWIGEAPDSRSRRPMLQALALLQPSGYAEILAEHAGQLGENYHSLLAEALRRRGDVPRMVKLLEGTSEWYRTNLLEQLVEMGWAGADEAILKALEDSADPYIVGLIGRRKLEAAAPKLEELSGGGEVSLILASIRALSRLKSDAFDRHAARWFSSDQEAVVRAVLWAAGERGRCGEVTREQIVARMEVKETRWQAMRALTGIWKAEAPALLAPWLKHADGEVRFEAALALAWADEQAAAARMRELVKDARPEVRRQAAYWLAERRDAAAAPVLRADLEERPGHDPQHAVGWLARMHDPAASLGLYHRFLMGYGVPFELNALAQPKAWDRLAAMPIPAGAPVWPTLAELADWLGAHGVPVRWDPSVRPSFRRDHVGTGGKNVLELLERVHNLSRGSKVRLEADGTVVIESMLTARQGWFDWWEKQNP
jgi:HEAT repeat protein